MRIAVFERSLRFGLIAAAPKPGTPPRAPTVMHASA